MAYKPRASYAWEDREKWVQLPFPVEEYQARVDKLRAEMEKEGFDALLIHGMPARSGHVRYVANFNSFLGNTVVVIPKSGDPALMSAFLHYDIKPMNLARRGILRSEGEFRGSSMFWTLQLNGLLSGLPHPTTG